MCGITGAFSFKDEKFDAGVLRRMNDQLIHRGPDSDGYHFGKNCALAMRRLKVIDLETGNQPIRDETQSLWIVFNGEIYNYRELRAELEKKGHKFYTHSDTEVILHQYKEEGEKCLGRFFGMFAFAIYDAKNESLFIARDRLGIKPLFYHQSHAHFLFGSEIKALLASGMVPKELDYQSLSHFLSLNYLPSPWTPVSGVKQLPPGHFMKINRNGVSVEQYWEIPTDQIDVSEEEAMKEIEAIMHRSIERRLIADVPVGAFLSGGMDSSTLVAFMKEHKQGQINTFSVGFAEQGFDETPYALEVAKAFGTKHHELHCSWSDVPDVLPKIAWQADNLLADQAALPLYMVSKLAKQHVTVCLSGDGGDETFVGYPTFHANVYHRYYSRIPEFLRKNLIESLVGRIPVSNGKVSFDYKAKKFVEAGSMSPEKAHYWWRTIFTEKEKWDLLTPETLDKITERDAFEAYEAEFRKTEGLDFQSRALFADLKVWLAGNNLYKVDTMTMAHGLEGRVPFLDHELVEYVSRLPSDLRFRNGTLKYLLKKLVKNRLPEAVTSRKKAGWHAPIGVWFRGPLKGYVRDSLRPKNHEWWNSLFHAKHIDRLVEEHFAGKGNHSFKIWGLLVLRHWLDQYLSGTKKAEHAAQVR